MDLDKVAIITLNWKNADTSIECIDSLLNQAYPNFQIFVLDNGSCDGSAQKIEDWCRARLHDDFISVAAEEAERMTLLQKVVLLKSNENLGFAGGNNLAIRIAIMKGFKYVWLINNDTVHEANSLSALVLTAESDRKAGMITSKVLYFASPDVIESMGSKLFIPFGIFRHIGRGMKSSSVSPAPFEVPLVYGCSFLVREQMIRDVGLMDERFFLLIEEGDWSLRARRRGWKIYASPASAVWHKVSLSIGQRSEAFFYYVTRNTLLFMRKHYPGFLPLAAIVMFPLVAGLIIADTFYSERKNPLQRFKMVLLGYRHFLQGRFGKLM
jgi:GT2 family glycosyltransferase